MNQKTLANGIFEIIDSGATPHARATARLVLICRDGRVFGADPKGRIYMGELLRDRRHPARTSVLSGTYEIPLRRRKRRCPHLRSPSIRIPITAEIDPLARYQNATVVVGGRRVDIEINYLGPLPP